MTLKVIFKRSKFILFFIVILLLTACLNGDDKIISSGLFKEYIEVEGIQRRYAIFIPSGIDSLQSVPLVFELHGGGIYIEDETGESGYKSPFKLWMELAEREKFIVVYPEGLNGAYGKPAWNDCRKDCIVNPDSDDVLFINNLITAISVDYPVDSGRIYASGMSNGGFMAQRLGIELNDKIAAIASVAASKPAVSECRKPSRPLSVLFMFGTDDNHMPYDGGFVGDPPNPYHGSVIPALATIDYWVRFNHTGIIPEYKEFPDLDPNDGGIVERYSYKHGNGGTEVVFYKINGAGHSAPSIRERYSPLFEKYFNKQNHDIETTTEIWNFFKDKRLR